MKNKNTAPSPLLDKAGANVGLFAKDGTKTVLSSFISIIIGMFVGSLIVVIVSLFNDSIDARSAWEGIRLIFLGVFSTGRDAAGELTFGFNPTNFGDMLFRATPIILTGLSVAVAYKTGLFNIGASGQYLMGTAATLSIALGIPSSAVNPTVIWVLAFFGGILAGALWGAVPGILKALLNINEVIACIMTNWIAANLVTWYFDVNKRFQNASEAGKAAYVCKTTSNGVATSKLLLDKVFPGSQVNGCIIIAIIIAVIVYIVMNKTTFGYQLKACGANRFAAKYAGINDKRNIILSMAIAGGLAGSAAALYWLSGNTEFYWTTYQSLPAEGFNGIPVAFLAANNPIGVIFSGILMSMLNIAGLQIKNLTTFNEYLTDIIIAVIVYLSSFVLLIKLFIGKLLDKKNKKSTRSKETVVETSAFEDEIKPIEAENGEATE